LNEEISIWKQYPIKLIQSLCAEFIKDEEIVGNRLTTISQQGDKPVHSNIYGVELTFMGIHYQRNGKKEQVEKS
jgi:hypothetical protein